MSPSVGGGSGAKPAARLRNLGLVFSGVLVLVLLRLLQVSVAEHDTWLLRSYRNRWAFRDVPVQRGAIRDVRGSVLAQDQPCFRLEGYFREFRRGHPLGLAVHGAGLLRRMRAGLAGEGPGESGIARPEPIRLDDPLHGEAAFHLLVQQPVGGLWNSPGITPEGASSGDLQDLRFYTIRCLQALQLGRWSRLQKQLKGAAADHPERPVLDVLTASGLPDPWPRYRMVVREWFQLSERLGPIWRGETLVGWFEEWRRARLDGMGVEQEMDFGERLRLLAPDLDHDAALAVKLVEQRQPGLRLWPAVRRARPGHRGAPESDSLGRYLGGVSDLLASGTVVDLEGQAQEQLPEQVLRQLVPEDAPEHAAVLEPMREMARRHRAAWLAIRGRRGTHGVERVAEATLSGSRGVRLVEGSRREREKLLWGMLNARRGGDVQLTIDMDVQRLAEGVVAHHRRELLELLPPEELAVGLERLERRLRADRLATGLVAIDARTGAVIAAAGQPLEVSDVTRVEGPEEESWIVMDRPIPVTLPPGAAWRFQGDIGSLAKPLMWVEHVVGRVLGREGYGLVSDFEECDGSFSSWGEKYPIRCSGGAHWGAGRVPVDAIAKSCNGFFGQVAMDLGVPGIRRAYQRFGLLDPDLMVMRPEVPEGTWQVEIPGLGETLTDMFEPRVDLIRRGAGGVMAPRKRDIAMTGIGWGAHASPLAVARAYAGLATGALPHLHLLRQQPEAPVPLAVPPEVLTQVREGLRQAVTSGTARKVTELQRFAMSGKTGTAEISGKKDNNAWFTGWLPPPPDGRPWLVFVAVAYWVPDGAHGGDAAGEMLGSFLAAMAAQPELRQRYMGGIP